MRRVADRRLYSRSSHLVLAFELGDLDRSLLTGELAEVIVGRQIGKRLPSRLVAQLMVALDSVQEPVLAHQSLQPSATSMKVHTYFGT